MAYRGIKPSEVDTGTLLNRKKRLALIRRFYSIQGKKIIDCGCGTGQYVLAFLEAGGDAFGIEYQKVKVAEFKRDFPQFAARVYEGDIEQMQFASASFDMALLNEVLEHVPNERKALKEIYRILKPNSYSFIFSPNRLYPFETHTVGLKFLIRISLYIF